MKKYFSVFKGVKLPVILILLTLVSSIVMQSSELEMATMTADIIDATQTAVNGKSLINYITTAALVAVANILSVYFEIRMEETINHRIRVKLWNKFMHLPAKFYDTDNGNTLISRITSDAAAPSSLFTVAVSFVSCTYTTIAAFVKLYDYNTYLANISLLIIPLTLIASVVFGIIQFKIGVYGTVTMSGSLGYIAERVNNFRLIKSAVAEKAELKKGSQTFKRMYIADFLSWLTVSGYQLCRCLFSIMFIVVVFVIGGSFVSKGILSIADLTAFYMITGTVSIQLMQFFMNVGSVAGTFGTMKKIAEISDAVSETSGNETVPETACDIVFENVDFSYDDEHTVLKNVSFKIPKGKVTAIIGGNGAGKSTVFKLLSRLYDPQSGTIYYGDKNITDFRLENWRDKFAVVSQNTPLISGTVRENITYGIEREISEEELIAVAKRANCYDFITEKPNGFDEEVGLDGSNFSGGQAQCISIARAMLRNADYLLLDEATSNLDVVSEAAVTDAIDKLTENRTTVMIAHSFAATRNADYVIVMSDGVAEAAGTPQELLERNEYYKLFSNTL